MGHQALQRVAVRMLYDPAFVDRVYADPRAATADCELDDEEREWLVRPDRRAWGVDPLRAARSLTSLLEEFPVSTAWWRARRADEPPARGSTAPPSPMAFFSDPVFHEGMQRGESLAALYARWLARLEPPDPHRQAFVEIEAALARARRTPRVSSEQPSRGGLPERVALAARCTQVRVPAGAVAGYAAVLESLRSARRPLAEAVIASEGSFEVPPLAPAASEAVLVDARVGEGRLEILGDEVAALLEASVRPVSRVAWLARAKALGATPAQAEGLLADFLDDGVLEGDAVADDEA